MEEKILQYTKATIEWILGGIVALGTALKNRKLRVDSRLLNIVKERVKKRQEEDAKREEKLFNLLEEVRKLMKDEKQDNAKRFRAGMLFNGEMKKKLLAEVDRCEGCGRTDLPLTLDHIIPKALLMDFGINAYFEPDERNCRLLCQRCNSMKAHHLDLTDYRTKALLMELLKAFPGPENYQEALGKERERRGHLTNGLSQYPSWLQQKLERKWMKL